MVDIFSLSNMLVMHDASSMPHGLLEVEIAQIDKVEGAKGDSV